MNVYLKALTLAMELTVRLLAAIETKRAQHEKDKISNDPIGSFESEFVRKESVRLGEATVDRSGKDS